MSRLYFSENGRVVPTLCEEITIFRRVRKVLSLPSTAAQGRVYLLARAYGDEIPLRMSLNGTEVDPIQPLYPGKYGWYEVPVAASLFKEGDNAFEIWTDSTAMTAWSLAIEAGHAQPESFISGDGGKTWRNDRMGYLNVVRGEYVVRVRLSEGEDPAPPAMVWEDKNSPRLESLRKIVPPRARDQGPLLERIRALSSWLSTSWEHTGPANPAVSVVYGPWDAETILAWGKARSGHNGYRPMVMCVHYAAAFVSSCQCVGIPARCVVVTGAVNKGCGHFVSEVWSDEHDKWIMVDPNTDSIMWKDGVPLSLTEIQQAGSDLSDLIEWGAGSSFQKTFPHMVEFIRDNYQKGVCFKHRSIWPRADLLSHPELSPPGHGWINYCETELVWDRKDLEKGFGMFPYFADPGYFDAPPRFD